MRILAIDPGPVDSAWVIYEQDKPTRFGYEYNELVAARVRRCSIVVDTHLAIEMIASYGMPVGAETFDTCVWIGRFLEAGLTSKHYLVYRREVKSHLCGSMKATDANVRQSLIDKYGPGKDRAVGVKATPGPLYGVTGDVWQALGVAVTVAETRLN